LRTAATDVVVAGTVRSLFVLTFDRLALGEEHGFFGDDTVLRRVYLNDLKLDGAEVAADLESVTFFDRAVSVLEVGNEVNLSQVTSEALN